MLTITPEQMQAFERADRERFKQGLRLILAKVRPAFATKPTDEASAFLDHVLQAGPQFGFVTKRQIAHFAVVAHDYGGKFFEDRKYPPVRAILTTPNQSPETRLEQAALYMHERRAV